MIVRCERRGVVHVTGSDATSFLQSLLSQDLDAVAQREEHVDQLRTLNEIGRLLSGVLDPDSLLEAIFNATRRLVDAPIFYIAFYDEAREWAYDRNSPIGRLDKGLDEAKAKGWTVVSMSNDWKRVFKFEMK